MKQPRHKPGDIRWDKLKDRLATASRQKAEQRRKRKPGPSPEERDLFRWLFGPLDPTTAEPARYRADSEDVSAPLAKTMEFFRVKPEKPGPYEPFVMRPLQRQLHELKLSAWRENRVFKGIVLKTRRYGMTTYELIESVAMMLRIPGWIGSTLAKDDQDAGKFFRVVRESINQIPEWVLEMLGLEITSMTRKAITIRHTGVDGGFMESTFMIFSANSDTGIGRGSTNNKLHPTEPPHYKKRAQSDYSAIQPSLGDFAGNCEVWESTAAGYDGMFQPQWEDAHWPDEPRKESEFVRIFVPAYAHPNFYRRFDTDEEREALEESMGTETRFGGKQERWYFETLLIPYQRDGDLPHDCLGTDPDDRSEAAVRLRALEQIHYMRMLVVDKCKPEGHPRRCQEYPMTPEEAFQSTGSPFFDVAKVRAWLPIARLDHLSSNTVRGRFVSDGQGVKWQPDVNGLWLMREDRQHGAVYAYGADTASGARRHAGGQREGDFSTCVIGEILTGRAVCVLRAHLKPREHAPEVAKAALYYKAKGYIERAVTGDAGSMITRLEQLAIGEWQAVECLLTSTKMIWSDKGEIEDKILGFQTRVGTKQNLCEEFSALFDEEVPEPREGLRCPVDYLTLKEMNYFERVQKVTESGQARVSLRASQGHDDMVMTWALFTQARRVMLANTLLQTPVELNDDPELASWEARWDSMEVQEQWEEYA